MAGTCGSGCREERASEKVRVLEGHPASRMKKISPAFLDSWQL